MQIRNNTRQFFIGAFGLIALAVLGLALLKFRARAPEPVGQAIPEALQATFMLPDGYAYRQDDKRWGGDTIGDTSDTLRAYGCTISSVAMAASNLTESRITPQALNSNLSQSGGFTDRGWLIWDRVANATDNTVKATYFDKPSHDNINQCMQSGNYPVIKIKLYGSIIHWVTIVGKAGDDYLIRDPLVGGENDPPIGLSTRSGKIHAVRCISLQP